MLKELNLAEDAPWKQRYRTPSYLWTAVASRNPDRGLVITNKDGIYQIYAWDIPTGNLRQATFEDAGVLFSAAISADGEYLYFHHDDKGNEIGHFHRVPFGGGDSVDVTPDSAPYASNQFRESPSGDLFCMTMANKDGFHIVAQDQSGKEVFRVTKKALSSGPQVSSDSSIAVINTSEKTGSTDMALEAYDLASGEKIGELWYGVKTSVNAVGFSPVEGSPELLAMTSKSGYYRPVIWNIRTGERQDIPLADIDGELYVWDWSNDGRFLLLNHVFQAQHRLHVYDLESDTLTRLNHADGTFMAGYFRPDGSIFVSMSDATHPSRIVELDMTTGEIKRVLLEAGDALSGRTWTSVTFPTDDGSPIQAWLATPEGEGPFPTIVHTHGGPTAVMTNTFSPEAQAWLDHGFAFFSINYRGSITFGSAFKNSIHGHLGDFEAEDIAAGVQWLIDNGIAQPGMIMKTGGSYGGYLTLLSLGKKPDLWAGGMARVAIADWRLMYEDQAETLRGYQRALFGGTPDDVPEQTIKSSPITYAENIKGDLLVIQGRNDTRCPSRQMEVYEKKLNELGKSIHIHWFDAGHGSREMNQQIQQQELMLRFAYRVLG